MNQELPSQIRLQLIDTTCKVFWYKNDLFDFLADVEIPPSLLQNTKQIIDVETKKSGLKFLVDKLIGLPNGQGWKSLHKMSRNLSKWTYFEGSNNPEEAKRAVRNFSQQYAPYNDEHRKQQELEQKQKQEIENRKKQAEQQRLKESKLAELKSQFDSLLLLSNNPHQRGRDLQIFLQNIFNLEGLNPRAPFRLEKGEIDGAFEFRGVHYLVEAKWTTEKVDPKEVSWFKDKIHENLEGTRGLMISINSYTQGAITQARESKCVILMDGDDLYHVLQVSLDLDFKELLTKKITAFSQEGNPYLTARKILGQK